MAPLPRKQKQHRSRSPRLAAAAVLVAAVAVATALLPTAHAARPWSPPPPPAAPSSSSGTYHRHHNSAGERIKEEEKRLFGSSSSSRNSRLGSGNCESGNTHDTTGDTHDKVADWTKNCSEAGNGVCKACDLWTNVAAGKSGEFVFSPGDGPRAKIIPTRALQGLESIVRDGANLSNLFMTAITAAEQGNLPAKGGGTLPAVKYPITYTNSLATRSRHQFHTHVGATANDNWFECVKSIIGSPPKLNDWAAIPSNSACANLGMGRPMTGNVTLTAAGGISSAIREGFGKVAGRKSTDITADPVLLHTGALVQRSGSNYLVFVVTNTDDIKLFDK